MMNKTGLFKKSPKINIFLFSFLTRRVIVQGYFISSITALKTFNDQRNIPSVIKKNWGGLDFENVHFGGHSLPVLLKKFLCIFCIYSCIFMHNYAYF